MAVFNVQIFKDVLKFVTENTYWLPSVSIESKEDIICDKVEGKFSLDFRFQKDLKTCTRRLRLLGMRIKEISDDFLVSEFDRDERKFIVVCSEDCYIDSYAFQNFTLNNVESRVYNERYHIYQGLTIENLVLTINELTINGSINTIFPYAFNNIEANKLVIGSSVKNIKENAFEGSSFTEVDLENADITILQKDTFANCNKLKSIKLPSKLLKIEDSVFEECHSLEKIDMPNSVIEIGDSAFEGCYELKNVKLSDNLKRIGNAAFSLTEIKNIVLPDSLETLGGSAFFYSSLETITLSKGLNEVSDYAFSFAVNLKEIIIPSSVTRIGEKSFVECSKLKEIHIPDSVTYISPEAFWDTDIRPRDYENPLILVGSKEGYAQKYANEFKYGFREEA